MAVREIECRTEFCAKFGEVQRVSFRQHFAFRRSAHERPYGVLPKQHETQFAPLCSGYLSMDTMQHQLEQKLQDIIVNFSASVLYSPIPVIIL